MKLPLVLVLGAVGVAVSFSQRMLDPLTALIARELAVSPDRVVLLATAFLLPYALGQPFLGPLADAIGKAKVLRTCLALLLVTNIASYFISDISSLTFLRLAAGLVAGGCIPVALALIADRTPQDRRQVAFSHFMMATTLAQLIAAPVSAQIALAADWHGVPLAAALLCLAGLALVLWQVKPNPNLVRRPFSFRHALRTFAAILSISRARICYAAVFAEGLCIFGFIPHLALHYEYARMGSIVEAGYALAAMGLGGLVYGFIVSFLVRRFGASQLMAAGGVMLGIGLISAGLAPNWPWQAAALFFVGFGFYLLHSGIQTEVTEVMPEMRSSVVSLHAFSIFVGSATAPLVFGFIARTAGFAGAMVASGIAIALASLTITWLLARPAR